MRKRTLLTGLVVAAVAGISLMGCGNKQAFDTVFSFDKAIVKLADGTVVEGKVENWKDYENSDQIQVKINGVTYLVHSTNITLIAD